MPKCCKTIVCLVAALTFCLVLAGCQTESSSSDAVQESTADNALSAQTNPEADPYADVDFSSAVDQTIDLVEQGQTGDDSLSRTIDASITVDKDKRRVTIEASVLGEDVKGGCAAGEALAKRFASQVATDNPSLASGGDEWGALFERYSLYVAVDDPEGSLKLDGTKQAGSDEMIWQ